MSYENVHAEIFLYCIAHVYFGVALNDNGDHVKATFLGNDISSHDIDEKKRKLEEISAFNLFSSMGKKVSEGVSSASEKLINLITE
jgi:hypothetical protein